MIINLKCICSDSYQHKNVKTAIDIFIQRIVRISIESQRN